MMDAAYYVNLLGLLPHPEGGYYKETYRSEKVIDTGLLSNNLVGERNSSTAIYFLLEEFNFSAFHRIKSDEMWHFYDGDALEVIEITHLGKLKITSLGRNSNAGETFQYLVPAGHWFASRVKYGGKFSLVGCTVSPGFDFRDFELADGKNLCSEFPEFKEVIESLTRSD